MLFDFIIKNNSYCLKYDAETWQDAVKKSVDMLVSAGCAEERYYDGILDVVAEHGPYFVIEQGIAMPHARPEAGALKIGFSLMTLKQPVSFGHATNDPVDFVLTLCAPDKHSLNEKALVEVMNLFDNEEVLEKIRSAKTKDELQTIFKELI